MSKLVVGETCSAGGAVPITNPIAQRPSRGNGKATTLLCPKRAAKIQKIGHPFEGDVETADQWNVPDPLLGLSDDALPDYMGRDGADDHDKEQKQDEAESRPLSIPHIPGEIVDEFIEGVK